MVSGKVKAISVGAMDGKLKSMKDLYFTHQAFLSPSLPRTSFPFKGFTSNLIKPLEMFISEYSSCANKYISD